MPGVSPTSRSTEPVAARTRGPLRGPACCFPAPAGHGLGGSRSEAVPKVVQ